MIFLTNLLKAKEKGSLEKAKEEYLAKKTKQARAAEAVQTKTSIHATDKITALMEYELEDFLSDRHIIKEAIEDYVGEATGIVCIVAVKFPLITYRNRIIKAEAGEEFTSLTGKYLALSELMGLSIKTELHPKIEKAYREWKSNPGLQKELKRMLKVTTEASGNGTEIMLVLNDIFLKFQKLDPVLRKYKVAKEKSRRKEFGSELKNLRKQIENLYVEKPTYLRSKSEDVEKLFKIAQDVTYWLTCRFVGFGSKSRDSEFKEEALSWSKLLQTIGKDIHPGYHIPWA